MRNSYGDFTNNSKPVFFNFIRMQESKFRCKALFPMKIKLPITLRLAVKEFITFCAYLSQLSTMHNFYSELTSCDLQCILPILCQRPVTLSKDKDCTLIINFVHE